MKKKYYIENLSCAHCAMKMEEAVRRLPDVRDFHIQFAQGKMILEAKDDVFDGVYAEAERICRSIEKDVRFHESEVRMDGKDRKELWKIALAAILFLAALILQRLPTFEAHPRLILFLFLPAYFVAGAEVLLKAVSGICHGQLFDENFLMTVATLGAFSIGEYHEGVLVMLLYSVGEFFQEMAVAKSRRNIAELMNIRPDHANLILGDEIRTVSPEEVTPGSLIRIKPGEKVPLDGVVTEGKSILDTATLTGESVPRRVSVGDRVISGCVNMNGLLTVRTEKSYEESSVAKILALIEDDGKTKSKTERIITRFARIYTPIVVLLAVLMASLPPLFGADFATWLHKAITCLVISCPCALVISVPLAFFGAIGGAGSRGILIKGADCLEKLASASHVAFDKTGTLTEGVFTVTAIHPEDLSEAELLRLAATCEHYSDHPISLSLKAACKDPIDPTVISSITETAGKGVEAVINGCRYFVGNEALLSEHGIVPTPCEKDHSIGTVVHVGKEGEYLGHIIISDRIREDSEDTVLSLRKNKIEVAMLSGDEKSAALAIGKRLGISKIFASLLPQDKMSLIQAMIREKKKNETVVFVGDGTNDAPVLSAADVGIAMGGIGADAAIEAADVVLMDDKPSKVSLAIETAKKALSIVKQNILLSIGIKLFVLIPTIFSGEESVPIWLAIFADVGVCILAVLNATRTLRIQATDSQNEHHDEEECHCGEHHRHDEEECHCGKHHRHDEEECHCGEHHRHDEEECHCGEHHHHGEEECHCGEHHHHDEEECHCGEHHHHDEEECHCGEHHHHDEEECHCGEHHRHDEEECHCGEHHHHDEEECHCGEHHQHRQ